MPGKPKKPSKSKPRRKADPNLPLKLKKPPAKSNPNKRINDLLRDRYGIKGAELKDLAARVGTELRHLGAEHPPDSLIIGLADAIKEKDREREYRLSDNALLVLRRRYLQKDEQGEIIETPGQMYERVAGAVAEAEAAFGKAALVERWRKRFLDLMTSSVFLPNSPTLMNAGKENGQLSACFVLPVDDSMESIFEAVKNTALIHKTGGGTGFSFSRVRPKNDRVASTAGISSGPLSFMNVFNTATETVKQGGTRRGANMAVLRVDHPDVLEFIGAKRNLDRLTNFNISVALTDTFWKALGKDAEYDLVNPRSGEITGRLKAGKVFSSIVNMAWQTGEPGVIFLDRINADNPTPQIGDIESTNPCGEQPLLPYESCNLGSVNLGCFAADGKVDMDGLGEVVRDAVRFLDDVIEINTYPLEPIREMTLANRKIGLGVMGFADLLIRLGIPYDSKEALKLGDKLSAFIRKRSREAGAELAESRGAFPNWEGSKLQKQGLKQRNATVTTIAPTGTISIIAGCSSGIEPLFAVSYFRRVLDGDELVEVHPEFVRIAKERGFYSHELLAEVARQGSLKKIEGIPEDVKKLFVTAHDIDPERHIMMQAAFQKHVDNAVSKTVNIPAHSKPDDVEKIYRLAYKLGCKGCTVYRYGSRESVLNVGAPEKDSQTPPAGAFPLRAKRPKARSTPRERSKSQRGHTELYDTGCGKLYVTVNRDSEGLSEVFTSTGRKGGCPSQSEAISRLVSLALRCGVAPEAVVNQLKGIRCFTVIRRSSSNGEENYNGERLMSCPAAIGEALQFSLRRPEITAKDSVRTSGTPQGNVRIELDEEAVRDAVAQAICPDCGSRLAGDGGCTICFVCGFSHCG